MTNGRLIMCWLTLALATGPVVAAPFHYQGFPVHVAQRGQHENGDTSLDEAVSRARRQSNGKVLSAETVRDDGRKTHHIKILTKDGRVKRMRIDARTGRPAPGRRR